MCEWKEDFSHQQVMVIHSQMASVDRCIYDLVGHLNACGMKTVASCCGHGHRPGNIALADGREIIIARDWDEARKIDALFPNIHGEY